MGAVDHRLDPQPANSAMADIQAVMALMEEMEQETTEVSLRQPHATTPPTSCPRLHLLQLHLRLSPKMRALEIPP